MSEATDVLIVGAGLTGLGAAYELQRAGRRVTLLDARDAPGGAVRTVREGEWQVECGPNTLQIDDPLFEELFRELGLGADLLEANPSAHRRYLVRGGRLVAVPDSPGSAITTPLFSWPAKLRVPFELLVGARRDSVDESVADFVRRRLGPEFLDYAIDPLVSGIHAGDPARLSVRHAFPKVYALERDHGGLIRGAIAKRRAAKRAAKPPYRRRLVSFTHGLGQLIGAFADRLGAALQLGVTITAIEPRADGQWLVSAADGRVWTAPRLVLALPAWAFAGLPVSAPLASALAPLDGVVHPPVSVVHLGYRRGDIAHPLAGFGCLIPGAEKRGILGTLFSSTLFSGRAPDGHVLLTTFVGGRRTPERAGESDDALIDRVTRDLRELLGIAPGAVPAYQRIFRWPHAIAQYEVGYDAIMAAAADAEAAFPGLHLAGHWRGGIAAPACIRNGLALARSL